MTTKSGTHKPSPAGSSPRMTDPADKEIHSAAGKPPYPKPAKSKVASNPDDDTRDPATEDGRSPHDRGTERDGDYETGVESMRKQVKGDDAWRRGETQDKKS